jgi:hypothetical protein
MTRNDRRSLRARPNALMPDGDRADPTRASSKRKTRIAATLSAGVAFVIAAGLIIAMFGDGLRATTPDTSSAQIAAGPAFVGSQACAQCHQTEAKLWRAAQHAYAMDHATDKTAFGDFSNAGFDHNGVRSRFFRDGDKFMVETDGPNGKLAPFEVKYTFGVDPPQQYLIEFPDGRIQALSIAWDTRPKDAGGQRWFHLYPNEAIGHNDVLHWTKLKHPR